MDRKQRTLQPELAALEASSGVSTPDDTSTAPLDLCRTSAFFIRLPDGSLTCATCKKNRRVCLPLNSAGDGYEYRLWRPLNPGEFVLATDHDEIDRPVNVRVREARIHGIERCILSYDRLCAAGICLATGWSTRFVRDASSSFSGRTASPRDRSAKRRKNGSRRRPPVPLVFDTAIFYARVCALIEEVPFGDLEFAKLIAILHRRSAAGESLLGLLDAYGLAEEGAG